MFILTTSPCQLMLKHRQNKNQKMRVVAFIASPVDNDTKEVSNYCDRGDGVVMLCIVLAGEACQEVEEGESQH